MRLQRYIFMAVLMWCQLMAAQKGIRGTASYYSDKLHGRRTSSGEVYHRDSLPFGTRLLVRNLKNGREVVVRVTDRGPFTRRFMIDLSKAAARQLDFLRAGICKVELTILPDSIPQTAPSQPDSTSYKTGATES